MTSPARMSLQHAARHFNRLREHADHGHDDIYAASEAIALQSEMMLFIAQALIEQLEALAPPDDDDT